MDFETPPRFYACPAFEENLIKNEDIIAETSWKVKYGLLCNVAHFQTHLIFHACQFHKDLIKTKWTMAWTSFSELKGK